MENQQNNDVVVDRGEAKWSDLWLKEDYWAIWIGFLILIVSAVMIFGSRGDIEKKMADYNAIIAAEKEKPFKTVELIQATAAKKALTGSSLPSVKTLIGITKTPGKWDFSNPAASFVTPAKGDKATADAAAAKAEEALTAAKAAQTAAADAQYAEEPRNKAAADAVSAWEAASKPASAAKVSSGSNIFLSLITLGLGLGVVFSIGMMAMGNNVPRFFIGFLGVFVLSVFANFLGGFKPTATYGVNSEIMSIVLGLLIANTIGTPKWMMPAVQVEYYIKTGLVLLGAEVLFGKILAIGVPGIFVAWVVTPIVLICTFIFGQKILKMPSKTLNIVISADMSVCGTSAAIATAAACRAKKEELTLSVGLSLAFTATMMIAQPALTKALGLPEVLGGAWIGGTIDATGSVAAAGAFIGPKALQVAATIKMIQNVLIGVTAFCVAMYWCTKVECNEGQQVTAMEIWNRFPKFVIGFLAVSIVCSVVSGNLGSDLATAMVDKGVVSVAKAFRGWMFALAFVSIGLATNFRELASYFKGGKPIILYVVGQSFNLCLTLFMAWIMFYKVFPDITASI